MPSITLKDDLDLDLEVEPSEASAFTKYFKSVSELFTNDHHIHDFAPLTLADPAVTSFQTNLNLVHPVPVDAGDLKLTIKGGVNATIELFVPDSNLESGETDSLFSPDKFGEDVPVGKQERYLSFSVIANVGPAVSSALSDVKLGFAADSLISVTNYQKFSLVPQPPGIVAAVKQTLQSFQLPAAAEDLEAMLPDSVVTIAGTGSLKFSAKANLLTVSNPLASADLGPLFGTLDVSAGASIEVGASYRIFGDYEIRARKTGPSTVRIGFFRERGTEMKITADASAGLALSLGDDDLFAKIIQAISPDAETDFRELKAAGLDSATIGSIQTTVQAAIGRTLEIAASFELGNLSASQAAFLYEIDFTAIDNDGRSAIRNALHGDLTHLVSNEEALPRGIKMLGSIFTNLRQQKHTFKVNLLGIYNFIKVSKLALKGKILFDPETGSLVISDTATATRLQAAVVNVGGSPNQADPGQLRQVLASSLLITAAYRASGCVVTPPSLKSSHTYCEIHGQTNRETMCDELDVAVGLNLMTRSEQDERTKGIDVFGRTIAFASTDYNDSVATALFVENDIPRTLKEYEDIGRTAMQMIAQRREGPNRVRLRPLQDDDLWKSMKEGGQSRFRTLLPDATPLQLGVITADYSTIVWWAKTMNETGQKLMKVRDFLAKHPNVSPRNDELQKLRAALAQQLRNVAADTKEEFGRPWGLIAMDLLSGGRSEARVTFTGSIVNLSRSRTVPMVAGIAGRALQ